MLRKVLHLRENISKCNRTQTKVSNSTQQTRTNSILANSILTNSILANSILTNSSHTSKFHRTNTKIHLWNSSKLNLFQNQWPPMTTTEWTSLEKSILFLLVNFHLPPVSLFCVSVVIILRKWWQAQRDHPWVWYAALCQLYSCVQLYAALEGKHHWITSFCSLLLSVKLIWSEPLQFRMKKKQSWWLGVPLLWLLLLSLFMLWEQMFQLSFSVPFPGSSV